MRTFVELFVGLLVLSTLVELRASAACNANGTRQACGFIGIDQSGCISSGCCWSTVSPNPNNLPYCFVPNQVDTTTYFQSTYPGSTTPSSGSGGSYSVVLPLSGGVSFCSQCGSPGAYLCSDSKNFSAQTWQDQTPQGNLAVGFKLVLTGSFGCSELDTSIFIVSINNIPVIAGDVEATDSKCACNSCDGSVTFFSGSFTHGFPLLSSNTISFAPMGSSACLHSATLTVSYAPVPSYKVLARQFSFSGSSYPVNNFCSPTGSKIVFGQSAATLSFSDPLPSGSLLVGVDLVLFGQWFYPSSSTYNTDQCVSNNTIRATFANQNLFQPARVSRPRNLGDPTVSQPECTVFGSSPAPPGSAGCNTPINFNTISFYQNGIPGYRYGSTNSIVVDSAPGSGYIGTYSVIFYYVPRPGPLE